MNRRATLASALLLLTSVLPVPLLAQDAPELVPSRVRYSDTGLPRATGRSGNAAIESEALMFPGGITRIMLTTGAIGQPYSGAGQIDKVQYKTGETVTNYRNDAPTPWFRLQPTDLVRHQPLQFQVHVNGIDGREDIVTVDDVVKLAPDIAVESVDYPSTAPAGVPFPVEVVLRERNGDAGATVSCVLFAGNRFGDIVENVWVDANGTVTCSMLATFVAPGTFDLGVEVQTNAPSDYDHANNSSWGQVVITPPAAPPGAFDHWTATARLEEVDRRITTRSLAYPEVNEQHETGWRTTSTFHGTINAAIDVTNAALAFSESTEGTLIQSAPNSLRLLAGQPRPDGSRCASYFLSRFTTGTLCSGAGATTLTYRRTAAQVIYLSRAWFESVDENGKTVIDEWYYLRMPSNAGTRVRYGSSVELTFELYAEGGWWRVDPFIPMSPFEDVNSTSTSCTVHYCRTTSERVWGLAGTDSSD